MGVGADRVDGVCLPRTITCIRQAVMGEQAVEHDAGTFFYLERDHFRHIDRRRVKYLKLSSAAIISMKPRPQSRLMPARFGPHTTVLNARIF